MGINCLQLLWARHFWRAHFLLSHFLERNHLAPPLLRRVGRFRGGSCRGGFHEAADLLCRASLHIVGDMSVRVQREAGAVVPQHTGHRFHIGAGLQRRATNVCLRSWKRTCSSMPAFFSSFWLILDTASGLQ